MDKKKINFPPLDTWEEYRRVVFLMDKREVLIKLVPKYH